MCQSVVRCEGTQSESSGSEAESTPRPLFGAPFLAQSKCGLMSVVKTTMSTRAAVVAARRESSYFHLAPNRHRSHDSIHRVRAQGELAQHCLQPRGSTSSPLQDSHHCRAMRRHLRHLLGGDAQSPFWPPLHLWNQILPPILCWHDHVNVTAAQ